MDYVVTPNEAGNMDRRAITKYKIPGMVLMENAAIRAFDIICKNYELSSNRRVAVIAGGGNNGGDGLAIARHLYLKGVNVKVFILAKHDKIRGDAKVNLDIIEELKLPIQWIKDDTKPLELYTMKCSLIVDAIFGTGLSKPVEGIFYSVIDIINKSNVPIVAVDIPSGIDGATGKIMGNAVRANHTITFGYYKRGHLLYPGRRYCGDVYVVPISLPSDSAKMEGVKTFTMDRRGAASMLKSRPPEGHKGTFGRVGIIAGSRGMTGASYLTSMAAQMSGAGTVTLGIPKSLQSIMAGKLTEVMTFCLEDNGLGYITQESLKDIYALIKDKDVLAIGPGISQNNEIQRLLWNIFGKIDISIVLDADGLNNISDNIEVLTEHRKPVVITPHPGEMARLTGKSVEYILENPVEVALEFAKRLGVIVLLKGATSVVASPAGKIYLNATGNSGMGTGGSGDVLTGVITSLMAQGYEPFDAVVLGCFVHGMAGDMAKDEKGEMGMMAGDILRAIPYAFKALQDTVLL